MSSLDQASSDVRILQAGSTNWLRGTLSLGPEGLTFLDFEAKKPAPVLFVRSAELLSCSEPPHLSTLPRLPHAGMVGLQLNAISRFFFVLFDGVTDKSDWMHRINRAVTVTKWAESRVEASPSRVSSRMIGGESTWSRKPRNFVSFTKDHCLNIFCDPPRPTSERNGIEKSAHPVVATADAILHYDSCESPPAAQVRICVAEMHSSSPASRHSIQLSFVVQCVLLIRTSLRWLSFKKRSQNQKMLLVRRSITTFRFNGS